jgi:signal transduction histidine kinase
MPARRDGGQAAFVVTLVLLGALGAWWTVLIARLVDENHVLAVAAQGASATLDAAHARKRLMLIGESATLTVLGMALVGLLYRQATKAAQQARRLESILAASTHELKTPMAGVRAVLESLDSGVLHGADARPHVQAALRSCGRLEHLVESVLAYQASLVRAGSIEVRDLVAMVAAIVEHRRQTTPGEELVAVLPPGDIAVRAEADALRVILENLLDNARKYGEGRPVRVRVDLAEAGARVSVSDEGRGLPAEEIARVFEPYRRGAGGGHGTGLGLYVARELAARMGGTLVASSEGPGRGATFTLGLPRADG